MIFGLNSLNNDYSKFTNTKATDPFEKSIESEDNAFFKFFSDDKTPSTPEDKPIYHDKPGQGEIKPGQKRKIIGPDGEEIEITIC